MVDLSKYYMGRVWKGFVIIACVLASVESCDAKDVTCLEGLCGGVCMVSMPMNV